MRRGVLKLLRSSTLLVWTLSFCFFISLISLTLPVFRLSLTSSKPNLESLDILTKGDAEVDWSKVCYQTYELAVECLKTNYYGTKQTCEALLPLLELSDSPRLVNLSSYVSALKDLPEKASAVLGDVENLTEERIEMVVKDYFKDYEEGEIANRGWCPHSSAYKVSKAVINAYTRILAKRYPKFCVNCVCPGFVKTDINFHAGILSVEEGAESPVKLALLPDGGPTGRFFLCMEEAPF